MSVSKLLWGYNFLEVTKDLLILALSYNFRFCIMNQTSFSYRHKINDFQDLKYMFAFARIKKKQQLFIGVLISTSCIPDINEHLNSTPSANIDNVLRQIEIFKIIL